jgi:hypothetical protein
VAFTTTTLWHFDAGEQGPSTSSALSLLREIQASILDPGSEIGPILLKLRFLASRLGSTQLEEWVKHESEGYPVDVEVPEYRKLHVDYRGSWSGPYGSPPPKKTIIPPATSSIPKESLSA